MQYDQIKDKIIALLISNADREDDVRIFVGEVIKNELGFQFINSSKGWLVQLNEEQIAPIQAVLPDMKEIFLDADYFIPLVISDLAGNYKEGVNPTGMVWE